MHAEFSMQLGVSAHRATAQSRHGCDKGSKAPPKPPPPALAVDVTDSELEELEASAVTLAAAVAPPPPRFPVSGSVGA
jgi:hypothetical protein